MVFLRVVTRSTQRIDENQGIYTRQHLVYQLNLSDGTIEWGNSNNGIPDTDITACSNIKQLIEAIHPEDQENLISIGIHSSIMLFFPQYYFVLRIAMATGGR